MQTLIVIAIGPVQSFIAAARRTHDLWAGSQMLSAVSRAVAENISSAGAEMIFPSANALKSKKAAVANKIVAILPEGTDAATCAGEARKAAMVVIKEYLEATKKRIHNAGASNFTDWDLIDAQLENFLEFYSAWAIIDKTYTDARKQADRLLAGRKALRNFNPAQGVEDKPKSSLDGGREAVIDARKLQKSQSISIGIKKGELLDGISLIKRLGERGRFVSTARVAADPNIRYWAQNKPELLQKMVEIAAKNKSTGLFNDFSSDNFPQYNDFLFDTQLMHSPSVDDGDDKDVAQEFCKLAGNGKVSSYYAVLMADGDHMGTAIDSLHSHELHGKLSDALVDFANRAGDIVTTNHGALIYSGGDDVLAFLPIDTALKCADELRIAFENSTNMPELTNKPTLSVGVSICHFSSHLQLQLAWARAAEKAAKDGGRNALAVSVRTRGAGEAPVIVVHKWDTDPVNNTWKIITDLLINDEIPLGVAYELRNLYKEMDGLFIASGLIQAEVRRILKRKKVQDNQYISPAVIIQLVSQINTADDLKKLVDELLVGRHLARGYKIIYGEV